AIDGFRRANVLRLRAFGGSIGVSIVAVLDGRVLGNSLVGVGLGGLLGCGLGDCLLGGLLGLLADCLLGGRAELDEFDHCHWRVVALAGSHLGDAGVAAVTVGKAGADLGEQGVDYGLVRDDSKHATARSEVTTLGERDQTFRVGTQALGLGRGG